MRVKAHTILFTEACPLNCRYCYLKDEKSFGQKPQMNEEEIMAEIEYHNQHDDPDIYESQLLLTGGEPFLYPELIKKIIDKYQNRFSYKFNTSGYLLTPEMLEYLSNYRVSFVLSVDGDRNLTNYLRPVNGTAYHTGYMKQLEKILPTLLYYFPDTPYRIIVNPRYVDLLYDMYLFAERLGFRKFTLILDFESRPIKANKIEMKKKTLIWSEKDTEALTLQLVKIMNEILIGWENDIKRPYVREVDEIVDFLIGNETMHPDKLPCQLFNGRTLFSVEARDSNYCMSQYFSDLEECKKVFIEQYQEMGGKCPQDEQCRAIEYCWHKCCPKNSYDEYQRFGHFDALECALNKACFYSALYLLKNANERCSDKTLYQCYIKEMEVLRDGCKKPDSMLSN